MAGVHFPKGELDGAVDAVVQAIASRRKETLEIIGIGLLGFVKLAYLEKSRGGMGSDGIAWAPIKVSTILARLRKAGHLKGTAVKATPKPAVAPRARQRTIYTVTKTVKGNAPLFDALENAGVVFHDKKGKKTSVGKHKAGTTVVVSSASRKATVTISPGAYQIGIDTGLQFNSAAPGFKGPDGKGGNVFTQDEASVTVGFGRSYSGFFDAKRKLIPDVLPDAWQTELEDLVSDRGAKIVKEVLDNKGVS